MKVEQQAEVRPAVNLVELRSRWESANGREERAEKSLAEIRLEKGRILMQARKAFPARGPKARGWTELLALWRVGEDSALRYMRLAGHVDEEISRNVREISDPVPTYTDIGIVKPRTTDAAADRDRAQTAPAEQAELDAMPGRGAPEVSDEAREAAYRREVERSLPQKMEEREKSTHELVSFVAEARSKLREITARDIHLTSVTTSPEDFMRAKQMLIDIVNLCLEELSQAGVLDGKEQRRQMQLLNGGLK